MPYFNLLDHLQLHLILMAAAEICIKGLTPILQRPDPLLDPMGFHPIYLSIQESRTGFTKVDSLIAISLPY